MSKILTNIERTWHPAINVNEVRDRFRWNIIKFFNKNTCLIDHRRLLLTSYIWKYFLPIISSNMAKKRTKIVPLNTASNPPIIWTPVFICMGQHDLMESLSCFPSFRKCDLSKKGCHSCLWIWGPFPDSPLKVKLWGIVSLLEKPLWMLKNQINKVFK